MGPSLHRLQEEGESELVMKVWLRCRKAGKNQEGIAGRVSLIQNVLLEILFFLEYNKLSVIHIFANLNLMMPSTDPLNIVVCLAALLTSFHDRLSINVW